MDSDLSTSAIDIAPLGTSTDADADGDPTLPV